MFLDADYNPIIKNEIEQVINNIQKEKIVIKPSIDSGGGKSVSFFKKDGNEYKSGSNILNLDYLNKHYGQNYLIQEHINQLDFFTLYNKDSVNTIRILRI